MSLPIARTFSHSDLSYSSPAYSIESSTLSQQIWYINYRMKQFFEKENVSNTMIRIQALCRNQYDTQTILRSKHDKTL